MSAYVIETDIPIPEPLSKARHGKRRELQTDWTRHLDQMEPGHSTVAPDPSHLKAVEFFKLRRPEKKFVYRKVAHVGWRVWRVA